MAFQDELAKMMENLDINVVVSADVVKGEDWPTLLFTRDEDQVTMPCRTIRPEHTTPLELMTAAFLAIQHFEENDDFLEWAEVYDLDVASNLVWDEFRALDAAQWQVQDLIGEDVFRKLMTDMFIEQAVNMAWSGFVCSQSD